MQPTSKWRDKLLAAGYPLVGSVDYSLAEPLYQEHAKRYQAWIQKGSHGSMEYLKRGLDRRLNPKLVFPELKSVIVVAKPYPAQPVTKNGLSYARYLNGPDYHETMKRELGEAFQDETFAYKICVDTSAVLERTWAALTGIGWIGKNTLLIHPQFGSYLFIGVIFTDLEGEPPPLLHKDYCGPCTRCITACPTQALEPHDLESRRCISYLTLEERGDWKERFATRGFLAGCDLCQEACPYNTKADRRATSDSIEEHLLLEPELLLNESEVAYRARVKDSALSRVKFADFKRNLSAAFPSGVRKK